MTINMQPSCWGTILLIMATLTGAELQPGVPPGWQPLLTGNKDSRLLINPDAENACVLEVAPGGTVGVRAGIGDLPWLLVGTTIPELPIGATVGVFINVSNGAMLKLELERDGDRTKARFASMAGKSVFGERLAEVPTGTAELLLVRQADSFLAGVRTGNKLRQIGILQWPDLPVDGLAGILATAKADAAGLIRVSLTGLTLRNAEWYYGRALLLIQDGDHVAATTTLDEAIGLFGPVPIFYQAKAWVAASRGDYRAEKAAWQQAVQLDPNVPELLNALAWTMVEHADDLPTAEQLARRANFLAPEAPPFMDTLAWILHKQGQTDEAVTILEAALDLILATPDNDISFNLTLFDHLGTIHAERQDIAKERRIHERLIEYINDANDATLEPPVLAARGWAYFRLGKLDIAIAGLKAALAAIDARKIPEPEDVRIIERLGDVLAASEQNEEAAKAYAKALKLAKHFGQDTVVKRLQDKADN